MISSIFILTMHTLFCLICLLSFLTILLDAQQIPTKNEEPTSGIYVASRTKKETDIIVKRSAPLLQDMQKEEKGSEPPSSSLSGSLPHQHSSLLNLGEMINRKRTKH